MKLTLEDRIREHAYSQSGGGAGDGSHFWLIAEREVLAAMESALASPLAGSDPVGGNGEPDGRVEGDGTGASSSDTAEEDHTQSASRR